MKTVTIRSHSIGFNDFSVAVDAWLNENPLEKAAAMFCEAVGLVVVKPELVSAERGDIEHLIFETGTGRKFTAFIKPEK